MVPAWKITPGQECDYALIPLAFDERWGMREYVDSVIDSLIESGQTGDAVKVEMVRVELAKLLDLDCAGEYAVNLYAGDFIEEYGEEAVREADKQRESGERHWRDEP